MATEPPSLPFISDLMQVFSIADAAEQTTRAQAEVVPLLVSQLKDITEVAKEIYGEAWLDLVTLAPRPAPRDATSTKRIFGYADACWAAKRLNCSTYRAFGKAGKRKLYLNVRMGLHMDKDGVDGRLEAAGRAEVQLLGEVWRRHRDECTALMEAAAPWVWGEIDLPGPPHTMLADHMDGLLSSQPDWLVISSRSARSGDSPFFEARNGFVCLLPILVGTIEAALDRSPSVRAMHQRLCRYLLDDEQSEIGKEYAQVSSALRYRVLQRDGFRCVMCGATAATGATLEVDHIVPRSKGGKHVLENLQTLCDRCNRGKGASLSPDLRRSE